MRRAAARQQQIRYAFFGFALQIDVRRPGDRGVVKERLRRAFRRNHVDADRHVDRAAGGTGSHDGIQVGVISRQNGQGFRRVKRRFGHRHARRTARIHHVGGRVDGNRSRRRCVDQERIERFAAGCGDRDARRRFFFSIVGQRIVHFDLADDFVVDIVVGHACDPMNARIRVAFFNQIDVRQRRCRIARFFSHRYGRADGRRCGSGERAAVRTDRVVADGLDRAGQNAGARTRHRSARLRADQVDGDGTVYADAGGDATADGDRIEVVVALGAYRQSIQREFDGVITARVVQLRVDDVVDSIDGDARTDADLGTADHDDQIGDVGRLLSFNLQTFQCVACLFRSRYLIDGRRNAAVDVIAAVQPRNTGSPSGDTHAQRHRVNFFDGFRRNGNVRTVGVVFIGYRQALDIGTRLAARSHVRRRAGSAHRTQ